MEKYSATIKNGFKYTLKRNIKKYTQNIKMPEKDLGKKQYYSFLSIPVREHHIFYEAFSGLGVLVVYNFVLLSKQVIVLPN